jgi:hypothetical protein
MKRFFGSIKTLFSLDSLEIVDGGINQVTENICILILMLTREELV